MDKEKHKPGEDGLLEDSPAYYPLANASYRVAKMPPPLLSSTLECKVAYERLTLGKGMN